MNVYLDESGDLGWAFDKPYRGGGSSRFLTVVALITPKPLSHLPKRIVKKIYQKRKSPTSIEIKGKDLSREERIWFGQEVLRMIKAEPTIQISAITVKKENVQPHIQRDSNKLYNLGAPWEVFINSDDPLGYIGHRERQLKKVFGTQGMRLRSLLDDDPVRMSW